jgi:2'-5' RNA ligase
MADHWSPQPGVDPKRPQLMWLMLLHNHPEVAELALTAHERLAGLPGLDLVPPQWLHVTTLIAGFADEITAEQADAMVAEAGRQLAQIPAITVRLGRVLYHPQAIMLDARPATVLAPALKAVQAATSAATGRDGRLYHEPWTPHVTLAYSNSVQPAEPVIKALGRDLPPCEVAIGSISLVAQAPEQLWTWRVVAEVPFGDMTPVRTHLDSA